jgi:hypothetical protein
MDEGELLKEEQFEAPAVIDAVMAIVIVVAVDALPLTSAGKFFS